jgi:hypothetical protein
VVLNSSAISRRAPLAEFTLPPRSRVPTTTGADVAVDATASGRWVVSAVRVGLTG